MDKFDRSDIFESLNIILFFDIDFFLVLPVWPFEYL